MYQNILEELGLNPNESNVYELLLNSGPLSAMRIAEENKLTRTNTYNIINSLKELGLLEEIHKGKKTLYSPAHPNQLLELLKIQKKKVINSESTLESVLPSLISDFNLAVGRPGIRYFEGRDGIKDVLNDSLESNTSIYAFRDYNSIDEYELNDLIREHYTKRISKKIIELNLILDTPHARAFMTFLPKRPHKELTDSKVFGRKDIFPTESQMFIYDNKISYITLSARNLIGVIIEDKRIYDMHKYIFEFMWKFTKYPEGYQPSEPPLLK